MGFFARRRPHQNLHKVHEGGVAYQNKISVLSGQAELNRYHTHPKGTYCRYTMARPSVPLHYCEFMILYSLE